jgi:hypothetical protein
MTCPRQVPCHGSVPIKQCSKTKRATTWWPSAYFALRLLARAVGAAAAGRPAGGGRIAAAVAVVVGHELILSMFGGDVEVKSGAASQPRVRCQRWGLLIAAVPVLVVVRVALVRVVIAIGLGIVVHGGSFLWRGLELDFPGEGSAAADSGAVDQRLREHRRSGRALAGVVVGCLGGGRARHG